MQKYFIESGTGILNSSQILKKWSTAFLLVKITALWSKIFIFVFLNSLESIPSTWINGRKSILTFMLDARSKYGDLSASGLGWETNILLTFKRLQLLSVCKNYTVLRFIPNLSNVNIKRIIGIISSVQRYKIKLYHFILLRVPIS